MIELSYLKVIMNYVYIIFLMRISLLLFGYVFHNGFKSLSYLVYSRVIQGASLRPLLFCYSWITCWRYCERLCFEDDIKIYSLIACADDCYRLQFHSNLVGVVRIN